jgi:hypothetical protein
MDRANVCSYGVAAWHGNLSDGGSLGLQVETFGAENVLAVDSTFRLKHHRTETVEAVLRFLGLDPSLLQVRRIVQ